MTPPAERLVVGITGATGAVLGVRMLQTLAELGVETHLVTSKWGERTLEHETSLSLADVRSLATVAHPTNDQAATISSGSYRTDGMVVAPCSMRTLGAMASGVADNLLCRAADVTLKERRRLVLLVRETPLSEIHLRNMLDLARMGVVVMPPVPAFYNEPETIDDLIDHWVGRALDQFGLDSGRVRRWSGQLGRRADGRTR